MKKQFLALGLLAAGLSSGAVADDSNTFYAGSGAGMYFVDFDGLPFDESAATLRVFGGYKLNQFVSFEAGYSNLFEASADVAGLELKVDGSALDLSVRPELPISDTFSAYGILGWADYDFDISVSDGVTTASDSSSDSELHYGVGGSLHVNDSWAVRGEYLIVDVSDADFSMLSVSTSYHFK